MQVAIKFTVSNYCFELVFGWHRARCVGDLTMEDVVGKPFVFPTSDNDWGGLPRAVIHGVPSYGSSEDEVVYYEDFDDPLDLPGSVLCENTINEWVACWLWRIQNRVKNARQKLGLNCPSHR